MRRGPLSGKRLLAVLAAATAASLPASAGAATINVSSTADDFGSPAGCSLREAVNAANLDDAFGGCASGDGVDVINVPPGTYVLFRAGPEGPGFVSFNDLDVTDPVTIQNTRTRPAVIDGNDNDRVLDTSATGTGVILSGLTIQQGVSSGGGGGVRNSGVLLIRGSTLVDNFADDGEGGAILSTGTLTASNVTVSGNRADGSGGGLSLSGVNSVRHATVADNVADADASGAPAVGGGIYANVGVTSFQDTIVAGNSDYSAVPAAPDCAGQGLVSEGHNLIGSSIGCDALVAPQSSDLIKSDARMRPLADNGGPTATHALLPSSAARNHGSAAASPFDQRGAPRVRTPDIGAYERVLCAGVVVNRVGTGGPNALRGTRGRDGMLGLGGADTLRGLLGRDSLCGGNGRDRLLGGLGRDRLRGGPGRDLLLGGRGRDVLRGGPGRDRQRQ